MADNRKLKTLSAVLAATALFLGGCDLGADDVGNHDNNNGIDTDLEDDSRGNDLEEDPEGEDQ